MEEGIKCPVCGQYTFEQEGDYDVCEVCFWENDGLQMKYPDLAGGANRMSLNQAREAYRERRRIERKSEFVNTTVSEETFAKAGIAS